MKLNKLNPTGRMGVLQHLAELRSRIIRSSLAVAIGTIIGWVFYPEILSFILDPYCQTLGTDCTLRVDEPLEGLNTRFMVSIYTGVALAIPVWLWQFWKFISPGLHKGERRQGLILVLSGVVLFAVGTALAFLTLPRALDFLVSHLSFLQCFEYKGAKPSRLVGRAERVLYPLECKQNRAVERISPDFRRW